MERGRSMIARRGGVTALSVLLALVLSACAVGSGFISRDVRFERGDVRGVYVYTRPGIEPGRYRRLLSGEFTVEYHPRAARELVTPAEKKDLENLLRHEVEREIGLKGRYPRAEGPGPGVVRLRAAVTGLSPRYSYFFYETEDKFRALGVDRAIFEAELVDSVTGETLAAVVDTRDGDKVAGLVSRTLPREATISDVFSFWGRLLRERLDATFRAGARPGAR